MRGCAAHALRGVLICLAAFRCTLLTSAPTANPPPADLVNFFHFVAEEVRAGLASMGLRSLDELIGRADYLRQRKVQLAKTSGLDLSFLTTYAGASAASSTRRAQAVHSNGESSCTMNGSQRLGQENLPAADGCLQLLAASSSRICALHATWFKLPADCQPPTN